VLAWAVINDELRAIQSVLNETSRAGNEGAVPATLIVGGQVITGFIVSQSTYQRSREAAAADGLTKRVAVALNKVDSASPEASKQLLHVYLRGARFVLPDIRLGAAILKLAIDAIDGFMFGIEGDEEGLVLNGSPVLPGSSESSARTRKPSSSAPAPAATPERTVAGEPRCPRPEFVEIIRRVANALEADEVFRLLVAGQSVTVPTGAELAITHELRGESGELVFRIRGVTAGD
jgi:hypothetical protein